MRLAQLSITLGMVVVLLLVSAGCAPLHSQAVKLNSDDPEDWRALAIAQISLDNYDAAAKTLATYAQRWPSRLDDEEDLIIEVINGAEEDSEPRLELLQALYDAKWNPEPVGVSWMWKELALIRIQLGQREAAQSIITRITAPDDLVGVRSDKRFDGLFDPQAPQFNVEAAAVRRADLLRSHADSNPKDLEREAKLARALVALGRNEEVSDRTARALIRATSGDGPFEHPDYKSSLMNSRAQALIRLGRIQEAEEQLQQASKPGGNGEADPKLVLNLGMFYCNVGRPDDSLAAAKSATHLSDYGKGMQASVQYCAALLKNDRILAERSLAFLREHKEDNRGQLLFALLRGNYMDEAAESIIESLAAADRRNYMLIQLQVYPEAKALPGGELLDARWNELVARDDVKRAVERVGRIEYYEYYGD